MGRCNVLISSVFAYNIQVGAITGSGCSGWVNYVTGSYAITFGSAPLSGVPVVAEWTNIMSTNSSGGNEQIDYMGTTASNGALASVAAKTGGVNAYLNGEQSGSSGWPDGSLWLAHLYNYYYGTQMATLPHGLTNQPMFTSGMWDGMGVIAMQNYFSFQTNLLVEQYDQDAARLSNFSGTISSAAGSGPWTAKLTLASNATGTMWEGEAVECNPYSVTCVLPLGAEVVGLDSSSTVGWGVNGSVYDLASDLGPFPSSGTCVGSACPMHNAMFYTPGNAVYVGPFNDLAIGCGGVGGYCVETGGGMTGALRYGHRAGVEIGAALAGNPSLGSDPTLDRTTFTGCDGAIASPCFDIGNTYAASASATWAGSMFTITGGLSAGNRPFVPGMALSCSGCNSGLVATSVSLPPTQSTATGAGQISQTFTITANGTIGGGGSGTLTGGCSGTSGVGSNCIDFKFDINTGGTYGTAAALNTCGANNLQGTNTNAYNAGTYKFANGNCVPTGTGSFVRGFRIGSARQTDLQSSNLGSAYDTGVDPGTFAGVISQNEAFTCNIVAATIVQCVKGPTYANGLFSAIGEWLSGSTFASYGDPNNAFSFLSGLIGYPGGQAFPATAGSGYSPAGNYVSGGVCTLSTGGGITPMAPAMGFTVSAGGTIINPYPTQVGNAINQQCSFPISFTFTAASIAAGTGHVSMVVNSGQPTGGNTIVPGAVLSGTGIASGTTVVSGPLVGTNGGYTINCPTACLSEVTDTVTVGPTAGSSGSITNPPILWSTGSLTPAGLGGIETFDGDINMTGNGLYDNSGVSGNPLAGKFNTPNGNLEAPGLPVKPFGMHFGVQVSDSGGGDLGFSLPAGDSIHYMAATGSSDSYDGLEPTHTTGTTGPWATPNHALNCGDVILAGPGDYSSTNVGTWGTVSNCPSTSGGIDGTGGIQAAALVCAGTDITQCHSSGNLWDVNNHHWAIEGFQVTNTGTGSPNRAFNADGCNGFVLHHAIFVNNLVISVASGFHTDDCGAAGSAAGVDYFFVVGNIAQNSSQNSSFCEAAIDDVGPGTFDNVAGTHAYFYGNYTWKDQAPGCVSQFDSESMMFDSWDQRVYSNTGVIDNNIAWQATRFCIQLIPNQNVTDSPTIRFTNNTCFSNNVNTGTDNYDAEINLNVFSSFNWNTTVQRNIAYQPNATSPGSGSNVSAFAVYATASALTVGGTGNENIFKAAATSCGATFCNNGAGGFDAGSFGTAGEVGTNFYENPTFANTTNLLANWLGAPTCTGFENTAQCMGYDARTSTLTANTPISDLTASCTDCGGKGYQRPSTTCVSTGHITTDWPAALKGLVYLHASGFVSGATITEKAGLVTKPCGM